MEPSHTVVQSRCCGKHRPVGGPCRGVVADSPTEASAGGSITGQAHKRARLHGLPIAHLGAAPVDTERVRDERPLTDDGFVSQIISLLV